MAVGCAADVGKGEPLMVVKAPLVKFALYPHTWFEPWVATYMVSVLLKLLEELLQLVNKHSESAKTTLPHQPRFLDISSP